MDNLPELAEKKYLSRIGFSMFLFLVVTVAVQWMAAVFFADAVNHTWTRYALMVLPQYLIAMPLALMPLRSVAKQEISPKSLTSHSFMIVFLVSCFLFFGGSIAGNIVSSFITAITGRGVSNPLVYVISGADLLPTFVVFVIIVPIAEEFFFRKLLIDHLIRYGERVAVLSSALIFALIHGNFSQFFYAYGLGLAFGYTYVKTGKLLYTIVLHAIFNFLGGIVGPAILSGGDAVTGVYSIAIWSMLIAGLVLLVKNAKQIQFKQGRYPLHNWKQAVFVNPGMMLFLFMCIIMFLLNTIASML